MTRSQDHCSLIYSDGHSSKFWKLVLQGTSHTVTFGRLGTTGQTQTKQFASEEAAQKAFDKLRLEKLRKGYVEEPGGTGTTAPAEPTAVTPKPAPANISVAAPSKLRESGGQKTGSEVTDADLSVAPEFDLEPFDWFRWGHCTLPPLKRETSPFLLKDCVSRLGALSFRKYYSIPWCDLELSPFMSREEAHFWFVAMTSRTGRLTMRQFAKQLSEAPCDGQLTYDQFVEQLDCDPGTLPPEFGAVLASILTVDEYVNLITRESVYKAPGSGWPDQEPLRHAPRLAEGFSRFVVPYLTSEQRQTLCSRIDRKLASYQSPIHADGTPFPEYYLAAALGMHEWISGLLSDWDAEPFSRPGAAHWFIYPERLVFGLESADRVAAEWRRLKLRMRTIHDVRGFIACTQDTAIDCILDSIRAESDKEDCAALVRGLALIRTPAVASAMLQCRISSAAPAVAREWLSLNVGRAVWGLIGVAGEQPRLTSAIYEYLRDVRRRGFATVIEEAVQNSSRPQVAARIRTEVLDQTEEIHLPFDEGSTPPWLSRALAAVGSVKSSAMPEWASPALLPPLVVGERKLNDEQLRTLLYLFQTTSLVKKHPLWADLRTHVSGSVRDAFAWKLFQLWQDDGYPSKHKWAMEAIGYLGDNSCVLKLTPFIRVWPGESQHTRAVLGLECLRAIGSSTALMQLAAIAAKLKYQALREKAGLYVRMIAAERGLTRQELEDRLVPDCGLDAQGCCEFSYGNRTFSFFLDADLKPMVRDATGKLRPNLPAPGAKDDPSIAAESLASWKLLKKQIGEVAKIQAGRLEQAMITGRRWKIADFTDLLVAHPLMIHLTRKLIWCGFDEAGKRIMTFRVTEERDFADADDNAVSLAAAHQAGVVHPLDLSEAERSRWGEVMGDYELAAPFPQLGRAVYVLSPTEQQSGQISQFHDLEIPAPSLVYTLEKLGWLRGPTMDAGLFDEHSKYFPAADVTAVIGYEGPVGMGYIEPENMLVLKSAHFSRGSRQQFGDHWISESKLRLGDVSPIVVSEVVADLQLLKSKAK